MRDIIRNSRAFGLIEIILVLVIVGILYFLMMKSYFLQPKPKFAEEEIYQKEGINTSSYQSVVDSARQKVKNANEMIMERQRQLEEWKPEEASETVANLTNF